MLNIKVLLVARGIFTYFATCRNTLPRGTEQSYTHIWQLGQGSLVCTMACRRYDRSGITDQLVVPHLNYAEAEETSLHSTR